MQLTVTVTATVYVWKIKIADRRILVSIPGMAKLENELSIIYYSLDVLESTPELFIVNYP